MLYVNNVLFTFNLNLGGGGGSDGCDGVSVRGRWGVELTLFTSGAVLWTRSLTIAHTSGRVYPACLTKPVY